MTSIHDRRYTQLVRALRHLRKSKGITQHQLAISLGKPQSYVAKIEAAERRLDLIELADWLSALSTPLDSFLHLTGLVSSLSRNATAPTFVPLPGRARQRGVNVALTLGFGGIERSIEIGPCNVDAYNGVENTISKMFADLNEDNSVTANRTKICAALKFAIEKLPEVNPSDVYQHIVYRLYLREYRRTQPDRSWVRAGGEAVELFVEEHYTPILKSRGIVIESLISGTSKHAALQEMGIAGKVGAAKLDVALYGDTRNGRVIFGGVHIKSSLAERVSDDVPCSEVMMSNGFLSILFTFDSKSFPPPHGDLVNYGELGTPTSPSEKRRYIEELGSFDACFSYNLRSATSAVSTISGKKIYVSKFDSNDPFPIYVEDYWNRQKKRLQR